MLAPRLTPVGGMPSRERPRWGGTTTHPAAPSDLPVWVASRGPHPSVGIVIGIVIGSDGGILPRWKPHTGAFLPERLPGSGVIIKPDNDTQRWALFAIAE